MLIWIASWSCWLLSYKLSLTCLDSSSCCGPEKCLLRKTGIIGLTSLFLLFGGLSLVLHIALMSENTCVMDFGQFPSCLWQKDRFVPVYFKTRIKSPWQDLFLWCPLIRCLSSFHCLWLLRTPSGGGLTYGYTFPGGLQHKPPHLELRWIGTSFFGMSFR